MTYDIESRKEKMHSNDRIIVLKPIEGKTALNGAGVPDKRLFTGENNLHAVYNDVHGLWEMKYDSGALPGGLDRKFTDLTALVDYVRNYFAQRNVEVVEVKD